MAIKKSELYSKLWKSCDELRGGMDASEYKDYILVLLFVKYVSDKSSFKKDLDNLLKILMDVIKEEMDDSEKKIGLGLVIKNMDEEIFEILCHKEFVSSDDDEGIDLEVSEWNR